MKNLYEDLMFFWGIFLKKVKKYAGRFPQCGTLVWGGIGKG